MRFRRRRSPAALEQARDVAGLTRILARPDITTDRSGAEFDLAREPRVQAAEALGRLGDEEAVPALYAASRDRVPQVRRAAVAALAAVGGHQAMEALLELATRDDGTLGDDAREAVTHALVSDRAARPARTLEHLLETDGSDAAVQALAPALGERLSARERERVCELALTRLGEDDPAARERARHLLLHLRPPVLAELEAVLDEPAMTVPALSILGELRDLQASAAVADVLRTGPPAAREAACRAFEQIQDPRAIPALLTATTDPEHPVRAAAIRALEALGPLAAVVAVAQLVRPTGDPALPRAPLTELFAAPPLLPGDTVADAD